jgi:hypothetical protein
VADDAYLFEIDRIAQLPRPAKHATEEVVVEKALAMSSAVVTVTPSCWMLVITAQGSFICCEVPLV